MRLGNLIPFLFVNKGSSKSVLKDLPVFSKYLLIEFKAILPIGTIRSLPPLPMTLTISVFLSTSQILRDSSSLNLSPVAYKVSKIAISLYASSLDVIKFFKGSSIKIEISFSLTNEGKSFDDFGVFM